jgi:low temperature requirement protein LtrA
MRDRFILIALGESIVIIGTTLSGVPSPTPSRVTGFVVAFLTSVTLWWLYFDQSAEAAAEKIARSDDPGRLGRSAYHLIHPVMVAGIIVTAAADEKLLANPGATPTTAAAWMILGGPALFLAGHAAFKYVVWAYISWPRLAAIAALVAATDRIPWLHAGMPGISLEANDMFTVSGVIGQGPKSENIRRARRLTIEATMQL